MTPETREILGRYVRKIWIEWAREQPVQKASWLIPWEDMPEEDREVDRRIGEALFELGLDSAGESTRQTATGATDQPQAQDQE